MTDNSYINIKNLSDIAIEKQIGQFIRRKRKQQNKTQSEVAKEAQISRSTLSLLENGETVTVSTLIQVLRVLNLLSFFEPFFAKEELSPLALAKLQLGKKERVRKKKDRSNHLNEKRKSDW